MAVLMPGAMGKADCRRAGMRFGFRAGLRLRGMAAALMLALACLVSGATAQTAPDREHRVKAVFLFNFAQFVQWPDSAFTGDEDPVVVGILGDDPFDAYMDEVVRGEKVNKRPIVVKRFKKAEDAKPCHVLFVSNSEMPHIESVLAALKSRPVLTVGESESLYKHGGMVCFATKEGRIRLKINLEAVQNASLTISSKLLRLADVAGQGKD